MGPIRIFLICVCAFIFATPVTSMSGLPIGNGVISPFRNLTNGGGINERLESLRDELLAQYAQVLQSQLESYVLEALNDTLPPAVAETVTEFLFSEEVTSLTRDAILTVISRPENVTAEELLSEFILENEDKFAAISNLLLQSFRQILMETQPELSQFLMSLRNSTGFLQQIFSRNAPTEEPNTNGNLNEASSIEGAAEGISELVNNTILGQPPSLETVINIAETLIGTRADGTTDTADLDLTSIVAALFGDTASGIVDNPTVTTLLSGLNITEALQFLGSANTSSATALVESLLSNEAVQQALDVGLVLLESTVREALQDNGVTYGCMDGFQIFAQGLLAQEQWALAMIDALGKPTSDLLGTLATWNFEGSYDQCVDITAVTEGVEQFDGKYCRTFINIPGIPDAPAQRAHITYGSCVPDICSTGDIDGMIKTAIDLLGSLNVSVPVTIETECDDGRKIKTDAVIVICILVILGMFVLVGTLYDVLVIQLGAGKSRRPESYFTDGLVNKGYVITDGSTIEKLKSENKLNEANLHVDLTDDDKVDIPKKLDDVESAKDALEVDTADKQEILESDKTNQEKPETPKLVKISEIEQQKERTPLEKMVLAFSVYSNGVKLLSTDQGAGSLGAINGIRFLSMAWVILGHTYYFAQGYSRNILPHFLTKMNEWTFMSIEYATVAVDSFFALSGILVAYLSLKQLQKVKGPRNFNWFLFYFHRFWRLTPPYMLVLMVGTVLLPYFTSGPMWSYDKDLPFMDNCRKTWWTNLLYINNLVKTEEICMGWSWYLSNDMQFYIISPLILLPLFFHGVAGIVSCLVFLAATVITTAIIVNKHEYPVQYLSPYAPPAKDDDYGANVYFPSYTRMGPYIVGLFTGYLLYKWRCQCRIHKYVNLALWFLSFGICCACVYGPYSDKDDHILSVGESAAYMALHRTGWGMAVCWVVFSCACGYGGWVNQILSWKAFIPLGRLTYCAYLVHPLVMFGFLYSRRVPTYFNDFEAAYMFLGHLVASYGIAFITSLLFESPMMGLEKALLSSRNSKGK